MMHVRLGIAENDAWALLTVIFTKLGFFNNFFSFPGIFYVIMINYIPTYTGSTILARSRRKGANLTVFTQNIRISLLLTILALKYKPIYFNIF